MDILIQVLAGLIAIQHLGFLYLEIFLWQKPVGLRIFRMTPAVAASSKVLAMNQGLYNGFLAAGLLWSLVYPEIAFALQLKMFFFGCVVVAGIFGGLTVSHRILWVQAFPSVIGFVLAATALLGHMQNKMVLLR
jgi:putative membrane protein